MTTLPPTARFERVRRLGEGSTGVVYEALDHERGTRVALKTLRHMTPESFARLAREFRAIQGLHHQNLVSLGDLVSEGPEWSFTMELVVGADFLETVRPTGERFDEPRLRDALRQLAEALSALHRAGFVHRDVKPSNVRITSDGRVVLLDFGLVVEFGVEEPWVQQAAGTPAYMAPEQVVSAHVGPEADWYALGVVLFEALTGKVPFDGTPLQIMTRKQGAEAPRPSAVAGDVPADLDALCAALLRFDPDARPTGDKVLRALGRGASAPTADAMASHSSEMPFVGRSAELDALIAAFRQSRVGPPMTVVVEGPSGLGKTTLVRRFLERLQLEVPDAVALSASCYELDVAPYRAVRGIVDALVAFLGRVDSAEARVLVPAEPLALVQVFPALRRVEEIAELARGSLPPFAPLGLRARAFGLMRELLKKLSARRPVLLVIDDAHWADDDSLALLSEVTLAPDPPRLLLLLTVDPAAESSRNASTAGTHWRGRSRADLHGTVRNIDIRELPQDDARALAIQLLAATGETDASLAHECARQARGDPLLLDRMTRQAGLTTPGEGQDPPFESALRAAVRDLDEPARAILEALCVAGAPMTHEVLARAAAVEPPALATGISRLAVSNLAKTIGARSAQVFAPYHERVRIAVLASLDTDRCIEIHRRIAAALETSDRIDPGPLSTHWLGAGDLVQAGYYAESAGDAAVERLAFDCAARFYERALSTRIATGAARRALLVKIGKARANAGWGRHAADAFQQAAEGATPAQALQLHRQAAEELLMAGDIEGGTAVLRHVLARLGMWMPSSSLAAVIALLFYRAFLLLRGMKYVLHEQAAVPPAALVRIHVCWVVARVLGNSDRLISTYFATRMLLLALRYAEPNVLSSALALEAGILSAKGVRAGPRVEELIVQAEAIALGSPAPFARVAGPRMRGLASYLQGRFAEALELNDCATARLLETAPDEYFAMRQTRLYSLWALAALGEIRELSVRLTRALREAIDRHDVDTITVLRWGLFATAWLRDGNSEALRASVSESMQPWAKSPYNGHHHFACSALAQADLYDGRGDAAFQRVAQDFPRARRAFRLNVEIRHCGSRQLRGRAAVLAAAQTSPAMHSKQRRLLASAESDARWLRGAPPAYAKPWAALLEAGIAGVKGDRVRAVAALEEAIAGLDAVSDRLTAAAARMRLGALLGAEGVALAESGVAFMREQEVADPVRMAAALVPGIELR